MGEMIWKVAGREIDLTQRGMIMGVLNVTPDSFSDGSEFFATDQAVEHGRQMAASGAQIIDVGGESTRPGAERVAADEELSRVLPVIAQLRDTTDVLISIDTAKAVVALGALEVGASIINDVTGGRGDKKMMALAAEKKAAFIIMHMQGTPRTMQEDPQYDDVVATVRDFFRQQYARALECGIDPMAIAFDPGIGFGKTVAHNFALLAHLDQLRFENRPIVVGVSRKSFLGKISGTSEMAGRLAPTIAFTSLLRARGAQIVRVHDVPENAAAIRVAELLLGAAT